MTVLDFFDDGIADDVRDVIAAWGQVAGALPNRELPPNVIATADDVSELARALEQTDWAEFGTGEDVPLEWVMEALHTFHRRLPPVSFPLLQYWAAGRLLAALDRESVERSADGVPIVLSIDSVFHETSLPATGTTAVCTEGSGADVLVVHTENGVVRVGLVRHSAATGRVLESLDPTLPAVQLSVDAADIEDLGVLSVEQFDRLRWTVLLFQSASMLGQAQHLLSETLEYLSVREQFGVPIGSFQALKHRAADLVTDLYAAQLSVRHIGGLPFDVETSMQLGRLAKSVSGRAAIAVASEAVQLRGGMGFSWESRIHFGLKRINAIASVGWTIGDCEDGLGRWAADTKALAWAGSWI